MLTMHRITAYVQSGKLNVSLSSGSTATLTPVTVPVGTTGGSVSAYGGYMTGWTNTLWLTGQTYTLPSSVAYPR